MSEPHDAPLLDPPLRQLLARLRLAYRRVRGASGEGSRRGEGRVGRQEFSDFRDYEPGDDLRDLDWAAYARLDRLYIKEYEQQSRQPVVMVLDASASMACGYPEKWRYARRAALALAFLGLLGRHEVRVLLLGADRWLGPFDGPEKIDDLAAGLSRAQTGPTRNLAGPLQHHARLLAQPGNYVLISDLWTDPGLQKALLALQRQGRRWTLIHVLAGDELEPELEGPLRLADAEGGGSCELHADASLRVAYGEALREHLDRWAAFCARYRLQYARLDTRRPLEEALLSELRSGGIVS